MLLLVNFPKLSEFPNVQKFLSTSEFAEAIGISESSVRRLTDCGELRIHRTKGGHRKIPLAEAIRYVREAHIRIQRPDLLGLVGGDESATESSSESERFLAALSEGHYEAVIGLIQSIYVNGSSIAAICDGPIRQSMQKIGETWPHDKRSIFIEHRATMLCVRALCQIRLSLPEIEVNALSAMGAAPQDDPYLLPGLMASLVLHECGFDEVNLGPSTPLDVLLDSVETEKPEVVWISITSPIRSRAHHRDIERLAEVIRDYGGTFLIGGQKATTYEGKGAIQCSSMQDISQYASQCRAARQLNSEDDSAESQAEVIQARTHSTE